MPRVAPEDTSTISHINYVTDSVHKFGDELYENLMERNHDQAKEDVMDAKIASGLARSPKSA